MEETIKEIFLKPLREGGCKVRENHPFGKAGVCFSYEAHSSHMNYWMYTYKDMFTVSVTDMLFQEDFTKTFLCSEFVSLYYYDSVDGMELPSGRPISPGKISAFIGNGNTYTATYRGKVPIQGVGVTVTPAYYDTCLSDKLPGSFEYVKQAFSALNDTKNHPELLMVMRQLQNCQMAGTGAQLYYESKVNEAIALIMGITEAKKQQCYFLYEDKQRLAQVARYLTENYGTQINLASLAKLACMSVSKLKYAFKSAYGCNISEYLYQLRIARAKELLQSGKEPISQIAVKVGYKTTASFTKMFKERTGLLPKDYRKGAVGPQ